MWALCSFFFSSRRRHTRCSRDWSSDVCSSDLIDEQDPEAALDGLADAAVAAGVDRLIVHARKAWLSGLSPRENRGVPPLDYARVYRLKQRLPGLEVVINGGVATVEQALVHLTKLDGVMMGRAAYQEPWRLLDVDPVL